jgi:uncharacterized protein
MDWILQPWPWYIGGPLIGLTVPLLLILSGKKFGVSSSLRHLGCALAPRSRIPYLSGHNWREHSWNLIFVLGIAIGAFVGRFLLSAEPATFLPAITATPSGLLMLVIGGILIGFGTRYADGCTSGHTIMGISMLSWPSLVASVAFFAGGLLSTFLIVDWFFGRG